MKDWQHGVELDELQAIAARFDTYNKYAASPFTEWNKARVAKALHDKTLLVTDDFVVDRTTTRVETALRAYLDVVIGRKMRGDRVVNAFTFDGSVWPIIDYLNDFRPHWVWIWQECDEQRLIMELAGYEFVGSKITSFAEIRGLYFKDAGNSLFTREHVTLDPAEFYGLRRANLTVDATAAVAELATLTHEFTNHYSNYRVGNSWSALSLRGYTADPGFIAKPAEMNKRWKAEHELESFELQDTALRAALPAIDALHKSLTDLTPKVHRIRLMGLAPGGGELRRHTDQVDKESGIADRHVARFHFPLVTNDGVIFSSWDMRGEQQTVNMRVGECWYIDTRKPHSAVNHGATERIHLVVDVEANDAVRGLLA